MGVGGISLDRRLFGILTQIGLRLDSQWKTGTWVKSPLLHGVQAVASHLYYTLAFILQLRWKVQKKKRNPVMVFEKCQLGRIHYVNMATFSQIILTSLSIPVSLGTLGRPGSTLSQRRYLLSCWTKGFSTPANFRVILSVRDLMWSAKNGTPKSLWIYLLQVYKGALVAMQRHLYWSTCSLLTWVQVADLQMGTHSTALDGWVAYRAGLCSWWNTPPV